MNVLIGLVEVCMLLLLLVLFDLCLLMESVLGGFVGVSDGDIFVLVFLFFVCLVSSCVIDIWLWRVVCFFVVYFDELGLVRLELVLMSILMILS